MVDHLYLAQVLMDELHRHRSFADTRSDPLHRTMPYIAHREDARNVGLEQEWITLEHPALGALSVADQIGAGQEEAPLVSLHQISQPVRARQGSNKDEHRICRHP